MVWNSVTLYNAKGFTVIRTGMMMLVKYSGHIGNGSWDSVQCEYVLPAELRPPIEVNGMVCVSNGQTARIPYRMIAFSHSFCASLSTVTSGRR